jgi:streptogramin lyase
MEHSFSWQNKDKINFMIKDFAGLKKAIRYLWRIAFFLVLSFQSKNSGAQTYFFDIYGVQQGLAQSKVYTIIQDRDDYVWLGTDGGASRFDGVLFENFTTEDGLAINGVQAIIQDKSGKIWFGHKGGGLTRFDGKKFEQAGLLQNDITSFSIDRYDRLWITTAGSGVVCIMNPDTSINDLTYEQYLGKRLSDQVFSSYVGRDSTLYFVTDIGIKKYNPEENDFDQFVIEKMPL